MRVTTKGRVTIPVEIRKKLNITSGTEVDFVIGEDRRVYIVKSSKQNKNNRFAKLRGIPSVKMSTAEIMALTRLDG